MIVKLTDETRLEATDRLNVELQIKRKRRGKETYYWKSVSYFGSLEYALRNAIDNPLFLLNIKTKKAHIAWMNKIIDIKESIYKL